MASAGVGRYAFGMKIKLTRNEKIVAVVPERCYGPGWANAPTWVHIVNYADNSHRMECIQPEDRTPTLRALFHAGEAMHDSLMASIEPLIQRPKK
jgi:hypothetical protein